MQSAPEAATQCPLESALGQNAKYYPEQIWSASPPNSDIVLRGAALRICAKSYIGVCLLLAAKRTLCDRLGHLWLASRRSGIFVLREGFDKARYQRSQFIDRGNVHQQRDVTANLLLMNLELDVQKQHKGRGCGLEHAFAVAANDDWKRHFQCAL
jgi:hypothetical protein